MPDYRHFNRMTEVDGILQFSRLALPDPISGYTLDDNARALMIALNMPDGYEYACTYIAFLYRALQKDGSWSNFMLNEQFSSSFDSEDSIGRALLACSLGSSSSWPDIQKKCQDIIINQMARAATFRSPRAIAYSLTALCKCHLPEIGERKRGLIQQLGEYLILLYQTKHSSKWLWFEDYLTYCNGILPQALFALYVVNGDKKALKIGHDSLNFLNSILFRDGYLNIIGNHGWYHRENPIPLFDQQPVDAASTAFACMEAYDTIGEMEYLELAALAHQWYRGRNIHGLSLYDPATGGCCDALTKDGLNLNQGAEAVLSLLLSDILMEGFVKQKVEIDKSS